jgi:HlyD family secretion protein
MKSDQYPAPEADDANQHGAAVAPSLRARAPDRTKGAVLLSEITVFSIIAVAHLLATYPNAETRADAPGRSTSIGTFVTAPVIEGRLAVVVTASGTVEPTRIVDVSTELSGTITIVHADANRHVKAGDVLAELDDTTWRQELARAKAVVAAAKARLYQAEAERTALQNDLSRKSTLAQRGRTSQKELEQAVSLAQQNAARIEAQKAELAVSEADLGIAETRLAKTKIKAPIDGIVLRRSVERGQTIAASLSAPVLFRLAPDLEQMELRVNIDEADALRVHAGQAATFDVHAVRGRRIDAIVEALHVGPEIVQGVVTYKAILKFDNKESRLRPGMTANADIVVDQVARGVLVPNSALRFAPAYLASAAGKPVPLSGLDRFRAAADPARRQTIPELSPDTTGLSHDERVLLATRDDRIRPVKVRVGLTDGNHTHVVSGEIDPDQRVAIDVTSATERAGMR